MIIQSGQLPDLWQEITRERAASGEKSLTVLHSISEVDSVCAAKLVMVSLMRLCVSAGGPGLQQ